jgi:thymidylate kinase
MNLTDKNTDISLTLPSLTILVEGIDGSGKDTFVQYLRDELYKVFFYSDSASLSIVGQPAFRFDNSGMIRAVIERGEVVCSKEEIVKQLAENRRMHELYLESHLGTIICIRGILTEAATLSYLYGGSCLYDVLGQKRSIDMLVVIDVDPTIAMQRILARNRTLDWRETAEHLRFFREYYLNVKTPSKIRHRVVFENNRELKDLIAFAKKIASEIVRVAANPSFIGLPLL